MLYYIQIVQIDWDFKGVCVWLTNTEIVDRKLFQKYAGEHASSCWFWHVNPQM